MTQQNDFEARALSRPSPAGDDVDRLANNPEFRQACYDYEDGSVGVRDVARAALAAAPGRVAPEGWRELLSDLRVEILGEPGAEFINADLVSRIDTMLSTAPPPPGELAPVGWRRWHLASLNDGLFIVDKAPPCVPELVLNITDLPDGKAQAIVDAHNAASPSSPAEGNER